jgi:hypothetical protein
LNHECGAEKAPHEGGYLFSKFVRQALQSRSGTDRCRHARLDWQRRGDKAPVLRVRARAAGHAGVKSAINNFATVRISSAMFLLSSGLNGAHTVIQVLFRSFARLGSGLLRPDRPEAGLESVNGLKPKILFSVKPSL